jgi:hypothetical protein
MPFNDQLILGLLVSAFAAFGAVLGGTCWYCHKSRAADSPPAGVEPSVGSGLSSSRAVRQ